jgi:NitT/TauT family transport system substrate-binding protein
MGITALVVVGGLTLAGVSAQTPDSIRLLYTPAFTGHLPALIAEDAGFFRRNGLKIELIGSSEPLKPLLSGDVDVALPAPAVAAVAAAQGQKLRIVMSVQGRITQALLVHADAAKTFTSKPGAYPGVLKELAGKKIGVSVRGGSVDLNLRYLITAAGLTPDRDVYVVPAGSGGAMVAALKGKQVDAILGFPPLSQQLVADGVAIKMLDLAAEEGPEALRQPFVVAVVLERFLEQREPVVRRFVTAMTQTMAFIRDGANRDEVKRIAGVRLSGVNPAVLDGVVGELVATMNPTFTRDDLARVNEVHKVVGVLPRPVTAEEIIAEKLAPGRP